MNLWLIRAVAVMGFLAAVAVPAGWSFMEFMRRPLPEPVEFEVTKGAGIDEIAAQLEQHGVVTWRWWFVALARWPYAYGGHRASVPIQAGEYRFEAGERVTEVLDRLREGRTVKRRLLLPEGVTVADVAFLLQQSGWNDAVQVLADRDLPKQLGLEIPSLEGMLFPATYFFRKRDPVVNLIGRMVRKAEQVLAQEWEQRDVERVTISRYQALIMASLIEKEAQRPEERAHIAGVFYNRLKAGMKLQSDPTVSYGVAGFDGVITRRMLLTDTPHNTYVHPGLPPTPICNPGQASLHAALHPEPGDDFYFVARGDGAHLFAKTLADHNRNVEMVQRKKGHVLP
jgi:UPF0755 protein